MTEDKKGELERTMGAIRDRYNAHRDKIIGSVRAGRGSASLSGIEYYPVAWDDLDVTNPSHLASISTALSWTGVEHDLDHLRQRTPEEMVLYRRNSKLFFKPHEQRKDELARNTAEIRRIRNEKP